MGSETKLRTIIADLRRERQISQQELADAVNIRRETIANLERGKYNPSLKLAVDICRYFGKTVEEVFFFE